MPDTKPKKRSSTKRKSKHSKISEVQPEQVPPEPDPVQEDVQDQQPERYSQEARGSSMFVYETYDADMLINEYLSKIMQEPTAEEEQEPVEEASVELPGNRDEEVSASSKVDEEIFAQELLAEEPSTESIMCACSSFQSSSDSTPDPTASEVLYDSLINPELYVHDDSVREDSSESLPEYERSAGDPYKIHPFTPLWNFGFNLNVPPINLCTENKKEIFLIGSHKGIIFNYLDLKMRYFYGHYNKIVSSSAEDSGKWIVTSDLGENSSIIVTDARNCKTIHTIYNNVEDGGAVLVAISYSGKYLISIHKPEKPIIKFWLWSFGFDYPNDTINHWGKKSYGAPKRICFHPNDENYIMVAFEKQILFMCWDLHEGRLVVQAPPQTHMVGKTFTDCTMALNCHECFVSTMDGNIQVYASATYTENFDEHPVDNNKAFIKEIKISINPVLKLQSVDGVLVTVDSTGQIQFYDTYVRLLYWIPSIPSVPVIRNVSFDLDPRFCLIQEEFKMNNDYFKASDYHMFLEVSKENRTEEIEAYMKAEVPSVASLERHPFIPRQCIASCNNGCVFHLDFVRGTQHMLTDTMDSPIASIDCSDERPYLVIAYQNGRLSLLDYEKGLQIVWKRRVSHTENSNTCIKFSGQSLYITLGMANGDLWFLNLVLKPLHAQPYHFTDRAIIKICHSRPATLCAFYDNSDAVYLLVHDEHNWRLIGKIRSHCKTIKDMMFTDTTPPKLFSIGEDRYLVEYNIDPEDNELTLKSRVRIEQSAIPTCFFYYPTPPGADTYFLVANSEQKYKMIREEDRMCRSVALGPAHGCYEDRPVEKMVVLPNSNGKLSVFSNGRVIGIQKLPPDGNPFKYVGVNGSPNLAGFVVSRYGEYLFTCSYDTYAVFMWNINTVAVDVVHRYGGFELNPYYCLIEGGENGWFFKEMMDLFCYMQILHQGDSYQPQNFSAKLAISELPDLLRSCGYYPSDYEIEDIMNDIKYRDFEKTGKLREEINFLEFVKLYINHKPAHGITTDELKDRFLRLFKNSARGPFVNRDVFVKYLCTYGEAFDHNTVDKCFSTLVKRKHSTSVDETCSFLPFKITFEILSEEILGILQESVYEETQQKEARTE